VRNRKDKRTPTYAQATARVPAPSTRNSTRRAPQSNQGRTTTPVRRQEEVRKQTPKRPLRTAAVQLSCLPGQYAETMRLAREKVNLRGLGIEELRPRRARTGALLLEIPGANRAGKADALARELQGVLHDRDGVVVSRPIKTEEIRLKDVEDSISAVEVAEAVALIGECQTTEVRVGPIRRRTNELGTFWVRYPLLAANRLLRKSHIQLGWTRTRIEVHPERPTACFKCLQVGHVRAVCPSDTDCGSLCYRCGTMGHLAKDFTATPRCPLCTGTKRQPQSRKSSLQGPQKEGEERRAHRRG